jgi:hypothetical protein
LINSVYVEDRVIINLHERHSELKLGL